MTAITAANEQLRNSLATVESEQEVALNTQLNTLRQQHEVAMALATQERDQSQQDALLARRQLVAQHKAQLEQYEQQASAQYAKLAEQHKHAREQHDEAKYVLSSTSDSFNAQVQELQQQLVVAKSDAVSARESANARDAAHSTLQMQMRAESKKSELLQKQLSQQSTELRQSQEHAKSLQSEVYTQQHAATTASEATKAAQKAANDASAALSMAQQKSENLNRERDAAIDLSKSHEVVRQELTDRLGAEAELREH